MSEYEKVLNVCKEMCEVRGYTLDTEYDTTIEAKDSTGRIVYISIIQQPKLNIDLIKYYYNILQLRDITHAILLYQSNVTSSVKKILQNNDIIHIELFCIDEFKYNILNHVLVPTHTKIGNKKRNDMKYPLLKRSDAVARFMGFKHGDIIRINRKDGTIYYRYVK